MYVYMYAGDGAPLLVLEHVKLVVDVLFEVLVLKGRLPAWRIGLQGGVARNPSVVTAAVVEERALEDWLVTCSGAGRRVRDGVAHVHARVAHVRVVGGLVLQVVDGILEVHGSAAPALSSGDCSRGRLRDRGRGRGRDRDRSVLADAALAFPGLCPGTECVHVVSGPPSEHGGGRGWAREVERRNAGRFLRRGRLVNVEEVLRPGVACRRAQLGCVQVTVRHLVCV